MSWINRTKPTTTFDRSRSSAGYHRVTQDGNMRITQDGSSRITQSLSWFNRDPYILTESGLIITTESGIPLIAYGVDKTIWTNRIKP